MAIRKVARMGHPVLRRKARRLSREELASEEFRRLIQDLHETMKEYGGIGIAAPQVHESVALALVGWDGPNTRFPDQNGTGVRAIINPEIEILDPTPQGFWEGCLSVPELRGLVYRPRKIRVRYWDEAGQELEVVAEGFLATVYQHELDHLEGVLFVDRIENQPGGTPLAFTSEYQRYWVPTPGSGVGEMEDD